MRWLSLLVVVAGVAFAWPAAAQREFIEDVDVNAPRAGIGDVDLDAPDVDTDVARPPPKLDAKDGRPAKDPKIDPKAKPKDAKASDTSDDAKAKDPKEAKDPKAATVETVVDGGGGFEVRATSRAALLEKLAPRVQAVRKGEFARARKLLGDIETGALDYGIAGIVDGFGFRALGIALARESAVAAEDGRLDDRSDLSEAARRVAPDDAAVLLELAHAQWRAGAAANALPLLGEAAAASLGDPTFVGAFVARGAAAAFFLICALLVVLVVVVAVPVLRLLAFDIWVFLPRGSHVVQGAALVLLAAAVPIVAGAGWVFAVLWILTLAVPYLSARARGVVVVAGVCAALLPTLAVYIGRGVAAPTSRAAVAWHALYDVDGDAARAALRAAEAKAPGGLTVEEKFALAVAARREGRIDEAQARFAALKERHSDVSYVHGGHGVLLATLGQDDAALTAFGLAVTRADPSAPFVPVVASFNASLLHHKAGHLDKAQAAIAPVTQHAALLAELRRATFRAPEEVVSHNRAFVDVMPPRRAVAALVLDAANEDGGDAADAAAVQAAIAQPLWHGLDRTSATALLLAFVVVWLLIAGLAPRLRLARACARCGAAASRRVDGKDVPVDICAGCFHVFVNTKSRVDAAVKLKKERSILFRARRRARTINLLSVVPGVGHLFAGAAVSGALLLTSALALGSVALVLVDAVVPAARVASPWSDAWVLVPLGVALVVLLLASVRTAADLADDERAGGRL